MSFKIQILLAISCFASVAFCDSDSREGVDHLLRIPGVAAAPAPAPAPRPKYFAYGAPAPAAPAASSESAEAAADEPAKYTFSYQLVAGVPTVVKKPSYGYGKGSDSGSEEVLPAVLSEFGHAETRDDDKTAGKYFVQLPDGRLQTVEYTVDAESGFVAKLAYDGVPVEAPAAAGSASSEEHAAPAPAPKQVIYRYY